jgi:hypothetical protein
LRKVFDNTKNPNDGKLGPNWEGPYRVRLVTSVGAYHLEDLNFVPLPGHGTSVTLGNIFNSLLLFLPFFSKKINKRKLKKKKEKEGIWKVQGL